MKKAFKPALISAAIVQLVISVGFFIAGVTEDVEYKFEHGLYGAIMVAQFFPFVLIVVWLIVAALFHSSKDEFPDSSNKNRKI